MSAVRHLGLYPYLDPDLLSVSDLIALEANRPEGEGVAEFVFHERQNAVYQHLLDGANVILSAPTSFGKSLIIDAMAAIGLYANIVLLVPTLALIDETRRRLTRFSEYKVITHSSQTVGPRNLFVLTQERFLEFTDIPAPDLFIIDEFYKLSPSSDGDRSYLLNEALYKLLKTGAQFYFLGPSIESIPATLQVQAQFMNEAFQTVALDVHRMAKSSDDGGRQSLTELCSTIEDQTLIFCRSPARAKDVARWLIEDLQSPGSDVPQYVTDWIQDEYTPEWSVVDALRAGVGVHHGQVPRALAQYMVRAFNSAELRFLVCTSTLIEGVNTTAKNVIIFDDEINRSKYDFFTFNNIRGRSGRMFEHFVGRVFVFNDEPEDQLPFVDVPALTQPDNAPNSLLSKLDDEDLTEDSRRRLNAVLDDEAIPSEVVKGISGVNPEEIVALARYIRSASSSLHQRMQWSGFPTANQQHLTCELIWDYLGGSRRRIFPAVLSAPQLNFQINRLRYDGFPRLLGLAIQSDKRNSPEVVVDGVLNFLRQWASFNFPMLLRALDAIQKSVLPRLGLEPGEYSFFAGQVENWFLPFPLVMLEEFGIPVQLAQTIQSWLLVDDQPTDIDTVLARLASLDIEDLNLHPFEADLLAWAKEGL